MENGVLQPGDEGYVNPATPEQQFQGSEQQPGHVELLPGQFGYVAPENISQQGLNQGQPAYGHPGYVAAEQPVYAQPAKTVKAPSAKAQKAFGLPDPVVTPGATLTSAEAGALHATGHRIYEPVHANQGNYDRLLAAYTALKHRVSLDPTIERQFDVQAGLIAPVPVQTHQVVVV